MAITEEEFERANRKAELRLAKMPTAVSVLYHRRVSRVIIMLSTGYGVMFSRMLFRSWSMPSRIQMDDIEITPSGLGIHFPKIDADLYLPALLEGGAWGTGWLLSDGAKGGKAATPAKAAAAKSNGKRRQVKEDCRQEHQGPKNGPFLFC